MNWLERRSQRGLGKEAAERVSAGCYGAVVAASTLAGSADLPPGRLALMVMATNLVYFGTHVFAYAIADPDVERKHLGQISAHHARVAAPMISAAFIPLVVVLVLRSPRSRLRPGHQYRRHHYSSTLGRRGTAGRLPPRCTRMGAGTDRPAWSWR